MRILSLAPTQTEILAFLEAAENLIGRTQDCDYPREILTVPTFGTWASPDVRAVLDAEPDLVCTFGKHQEEVASWLEAKNLAVFHSDPPTVADALEDMASLARRIGRGPRGERAIRSLRDRLERVRKAVASATADGKRPRILRIMHWDPLITVGPGSFQHDVIDMAGGANLFHDQEIAPYVRVSPERVVSWNPDVIFFCEPFIEERLQGDPLWAACNAVRHGHVHLFDCGLTCRSGPRIVDMVEGLARVVLNWKEDRTS
ncbi:iron complex transport system substrate-binding protein [Desulfacinum hydrothermale DSM 13146]|uniref:Iron complex transport system substrate-binding protein n=1 Tax=Desulfacinum hydrothermale DSM 13146 TaxID=1121390 RepID=A0A1W1WX65_9BACT|nr:helical backbone metal receptor [Desulfacinum hydrothermale]SMC16235.1 iron complex transport system substrate-binding protein [Desulfacinum hydrothermale DSM 13146]